MNLIRPELWPLWVACGVMLVAGITTLRTMKVPNRLSLPSILLGWVFSLFVQAGWLPSAGGGFVYSFFVSLLGGMMLLPFQRSGMLGAGCVKMHVALGAWVGCALGPWPAIIMMVSATLMGAICTLLFSAVDYARTRHKPSGERGTSWFPIQATLSLGAILCIVGVCWSGLV